MAGARWEDWGQAPLEAMADGALLATVPSGGPYEGLRLARRARPSLVATAIDGAALAPAIRAAFELPDERVREYREQAAELMRPYRSEAVQETVTHELLPALLGSDRPALPRMESSRQSIPSMLSFERPRQPAPKPPRPPPAGGAR